MLMIFVDKIEYKKNPYNMKLHKRTAVEKKAGFLDKYLKIYFICDVQESKAWKFMADVERKKTESR